MPQRITLRLSPLEADNIKMLRAYVANHLCISQKTITGTKIIRRSLDARKKPAVYQYVIDVFINEPYPLLTNPILTFNNIFSNKKQVIIIGAGPAGLFAALQLINLGIKPIILERGKDVRSRRRDLALLNKSGIVNPNSNYCFGEGGAGTYSDGKLYTRSNKRGNILSILQTFVHFGAPEQILYDAHPHIGTNKLPQIITSMREQILKSGGEIYFNHCVNDFLIKENRIVGVEASGVRFIGDAYLLATGHSARDIFELLQKKSILIEAKPFALGVRIEHPQQLINEIQYHHTFSNLLPPASYSLVKQIKDRGMFSFCMCPGGIIAPAATSPGEVVVNGWSPSKRNNPFANSGIVVEIRQADIIPLMKREGIGENDPLIFMRFQQMVEKAAFTAGGGKCKAPGQRLVDFCKGKESVSLPDHSYIPGLSIANLQTVLPPFVYKTLVSGFPLFGKILKGYYTNDAIVVATESRTSSPVKIPRDMKYFHHPHIENLYPCGEGAGYAGGIISAAMDGEKVAAAISSRIGD